MDLTLVQQGLVLMVIGMATVFVFLSTLVLAMKLLARIVMLIPAAATPAAAKVASEEIAAIAAAIQMHRRRK